MTPYALLLQACGLSHREAAGFSDVQLDTVRSWSLNRRTAPAGVINDLRALYAQIVDAAEDCLEAIKQAPAGMDMEIGYPINDHEARALGFPCVGAWRAMCAIVVAELDRPVRLVPRGSTAATAAAIAAHGG